jgi:hypothetical protein
MKLAIANKTKKTQFRSLFALLASHWTATTTVRFDATGMRIQCMDDGKICMLNLHMTAEWFDYYSYDADAAGAREIKIGVTTKGIATVTEFGAKHDVWVMEYSAADGNDDSLMMHLLSAASCPYLAPPAQPLVPPPDADAAAAAAPKRKKRAAPASSEGAAPPESATAAAAPEYEKHIEMQLADIENEDLYIPESEYPADVWLPTERLHKILAESLVVSRVVSVQFNETSVQFRAGEDESAANAMRIKLLTIVPLDELIALNLEEGFSHRLSYCTEYLLRYCTSVGLGAEVKMSISPDLPLMLAYELGSDSHAMFYLAPRLEDVTD